MANSIELAKKYIPFLDEIYVNDAKTSVLQGSNGQIKASLSNVNEVLVAKRTVSGLGSFSRAGSEGVGPAGGYTIGQTTLEWETVKYDNERSSVLVIDRLNAEESLDMAAADIMGQFVREAVIPETDAARIASLAQVAITHSNVGTGAITTGEAVVSALRTAINKFENAEVGSEWVLFIRPEYLGMLKDMNTLYPREVLSAFSDVIEVPAKRMYSKIVLNDGQGAYGYRKADDAVDLDFVIVAKDAVVCDMRQYLKYVSPDASQLNDAHNFFYRNYNLYAHILDNKVDGVYAHIPE